MLIPFRIPDGNIGDLIIIKMSAGKLYFQFISITDLKILLGV